SEPDPKQEYVPPILVSASATLVEGLRDARVLRGLLFALQHRLARRGVVSVAVRASDSPFTLELTEAGGEPPVLAATTFLHLLREARRAQAAPGSAMPDEAG